MDIKYDSQGRMKYHPEYHPNHRKPFTEEELEYICKYFDIDGRKTTSFAIGRTEGTVGEIVCKLKKQGKYDYYKNLNKYW